MENDDDDHDDDEPTQLFDLSDDILERICRHMCVPSLLAMERTCRRLQHIVEDDSVWSGRPLGEPTRRIRDGRLATHREYRCVRQSVSLVRRYQKSSKNILVTAFQGEFPCRSWREILESTVRDAWTQVAWRHFLYGSITGEHLFFFRGDTLSTVLEFLQTFLLMSFQRALRIRLIKSEIAGEYPIVDLEDLKEQERIVFTQDRPGEDPIFCKQYTEEELEFAESLIESGRRDDLVRCIAFRAGIPRLDNDVYEVAWASMVQFLRILVSHVCAELCLRLPLDPGNPTLSSREHGMDVPAFVVRRYPPPPELLIDDTSTYLHKPVPCQFEDAVRAYFPYLPSRVYGYWLSDDEDGIAQAEDQEEMDLAAAEEYPSGDDDDGEEDEVAFGDDDDDDDDRGDVDFDDEEDEDDDNDDVDDDDSSEEEYATDSSSSIDGESDSSTSTRDDIDDSVGDDGDDESAGNEEDDDEDDDDDDESSGDENLDEELEADIDPDGGDDANDGDVSSDGASDEGEDEGADREDDEHEVVLDGAPELEADADKNLGGNDQKMDDVENDEPAPDDDLSASDEQDGDGGATLPAITGNAKPDPSGRYDNCGFRLATDDLSNRTSFEASKTTRGRFMEVVSQPWRWLVKPATVRRRAKASHAGHVGPSK